ncbi:MAG: hypothetical protein NTZ85_01470 [Bacteroidia bacterium]|nr:hypothetical protein [Bacteroidia bacterium]
MKSGKILKILLGIAIPLLLIKFLTIVFVEPWVREKIQTELNEKNGDYLIKIDKVHILIIKSGIELDSITICQKQNHGGVRNLSGGIASIKFKGINLAKAIFKKDISINEVTISNIIIKGNMAFSREVKHPIVSPLNIRIRRVFLDKIDLAMGNTSTAQFFSVKKGVSKVIDLQIEKQDTLSPYIVKQFEFDAEELFSVSSDSMYSFTASGITYSTTSNTLAANSFFIQPNYTDYDFTSRYEFQTSPIETGLSNIYVHDFNAADYFRSGMLKSSFIGIGEMDMKVFRDKRKEFRHVNKPSFQDMIYNYHGTIRIDSIGLIKGNIVYTEHAEKANNAGSISFNEINAKIYKITNDTIYKTKNDSLILKGDALLMGKGKITVLLKGRIFDSQNTFSLNGTLSHLEANELNPILEKNAFIYVTSGTIDSMSFSFTANNAKATGKMTILYHGLDIAVKNKRTDDTTAFRERFISLITNRKVLDSNPIPDEDIREGIIDYERDPEKSLFGYCFKSILSGVKSSLVKSPKKKTNAYTK